jgi:tetratricopeptide (TPR) repeat protein
MLPSNLAALWASVFGHLYAAVLYEDSGQTQKQQDALEQAGHDAEALKRFPTNARAAYARFSYYLAAGNDEAAYEEAERFAEAERAAGDRASEQGAILHYWVLRRRGEFQKAIEAWDQITARDTAFEYERAFLLAELPDEQQQALAAYKDFTTRYPSGREAVRGLAIPLFLGRKQEVIAASRVLRQQPGNL